MNRAGNTKDKTAESKQLGSAVKYNRAKKKKKVFKYRVYFRLVNFCIVALMLFTAGVVVDLKVGSIFRDLNADINVVQTDQNRVANLKASLEQPSDEKVESEAVLIEEEVEVVVEEAPIEPRVLTAVLYGHDEHGGGIDTTILVFANLDTMEINLLSLPRDMELDFSTEARAELIHAGYRPHTNSYGKLTNWGRSYNAAVLQIVTRELSRVFEVPIEYYFSVDVKAFVKVVDLVGPIPFDVKQRMYYHNGERLLVNLQPGFQYLTGAQAEGLVRFRNYKMGDFDRTEVQRQFLAAVVGHVRDQGLDASDVFGLVQIALTHMNTNFVNPFPYFNLFGRLNDITMNSYRLPLELKGNSWRVCDESFELLDDILMDVYGLKSDESEDMDGEESILDQSMSEGGLQVENEGLESLSSE